MADVEPNRDLARLRLLRTPNIGPVSYRQLIARFGSAEAALDALPMLAARGGRRDFRVADSRRVEQELQAIRRLGARALFADDSDYPALLRATETAPPLLIVRGDLALLARPAIAIVGARNASAAACRFARGLARELALEGAVIVSGLARGIDTAAHVGALGNGTVGVIASGIDISYPPENAELQERIATDELLIAEQPPGTEPLARHFPSRNRIIAGLALGTVVIEAAPKSGSLITARIAAELGREVMAVPGSPLDPRAQGCNLLIRDGATLIQNAADVLEQVRPIDPRAVAQPRDRFDATPTADASDPERNTVIGLLGHTPVAVDEVIRLSGLPSAIVQTALLELELAGRLERHAGGKVSLGG
ncbi:DNA-protecting protein DprA [Sphingomonas sp. ID1715]|uniref:DNA-processing protein DprA n=1 Tax=Sphingomonas sp. ID1715 TaxID=1656898 RepID=UPI0014885463|nr:DNA-processing protein DprA [Sphingomonas sp. ID1715]NNM77626.1 DNA-protecting protein DprA [Sphingomonas sp. ID1715]